MKNIIFGAVMSGLAMLPSMASALNVGVEFKAYITMLNPEGQILRNLAFTNEPEFEGWRTPIKGEMVLDLGTDGQVVAAAATFEPFEFSPIAGFSNEASGRDITILPAHTKYGIPTDTLMIANMLFFWGPEQGVPVSVVVDVANLSTALMSGSVGGILEGVLTAESENTTVLDPETGGQVTKPMGPVLVATTSWNTTDVDTDGDGQPGPITMGTNPSGTVPLIEDTVVDATNGDIGIGGSPIKVSSFRNFNPNLDVYEMRITCIALVGTCEKDGLILPGFTLSAQPMEPVLDLLRTDSSSLKLF